MKVLLFSDLHAHAFKAYATILPNGRNSRLQDTLNILKEIRTLADIEHVDGILFGGDLFHIRPGMGTMRIPTFNAVFNAIAGLKVGRKFVGLLVGNHDQGDKLGKEHSVYAFSPIVSIMDQPAWYTFHANGEELLVFALPAQSGPDKTKEIIDSNLNQDNEGAILLGHLPIAGAVVGCNFVMPDKSNPKVDDLRPDFFKQVFLGDFHKPQILQPGVRYIGATHHHNWGDAGQRRGCLIWNTEDDSVKFHNLLSAPKFEKMSIDMWDIDLAERSRPLDSFVRIVHDKPISGVLKDKIIESYTEAGVRLIEFWEEKNKNREIAISSSSEFQPSMDQEEMVTSFVNKEDIGDLDEEFLIPLGKDILNKAMERVEK